MLPFHVHKLIGTLRTLPRDRHLVEEGNVQSSVRPEPETRALATHDLGPSHATDRPLTAVWHPAADPALNRRPLSADPAGGIA